MKEQALSIMIKLHFLQENYMLSFNVLIQKEGIIMISGFI